MLPETEAIPIALTLNEIFTNAVKHGSGGDIRCSLVAAGEAVTIAVAGRGRLASGFDLARVPAGVSGLGLVRALLPRRTARLEVKAVGEDVVATIELKPPSVRLLAPVPAAEPAPAAAGA